MNLARVLFNRRRSSRVREPKHRAARSVPRLRERRSRPRGDGLLLVRTATEKHSARRNVRNRASRTWCRFNVSEGFVSSTHVAPLPPPFLFCGTFCVCRVVFVAGATTQIFFKRL